MMFGKKRRESEENTEQTANPWNSYSDMMAALLLVFVLIMFYFVFQYLDQGEANRVATEAQQAELTAAIAENEALKLQYQTEAETKQNELDTAIAENQELQNQIDRVLGVKTDIIRQVAEALQQAGLDAQIDPQTGSIALDSSILFDSGKFELKNEGKRYLDSFVPAYISALLGTENLEYISEIIIEGHTDTVGTYVFNLDLSQKRALSVAKYCLEIAEQTMEEKDQELLRILLTANGRSFSNPILDQNGEVDLDASRRVEFKFRLKDTEMIENMLAILNGESNE